MRGYFVGFVSLVFNYMKDLNVLIHKKMCHGERVRSTEKRGVRVWRRLVLMRMVPEGKIGNGIRKYVAHLQILPILSSVLSSPYSNPEGCIQLYKDFPTLPLETL